MSSITIDASNKYIFSKIQLDTGSVAFDRYEEGVSMVY